MPIVALVVAVLAGQGALAADGPGRVVPVKERVPFTVVGRLGWPGMDPVMPKGPCPPACMELRLGKVPLERLGLLLRLPDKTTRLDTLSVLVLDPAGKKVVARTEGGCEGCGSLLPAQKDGGHLFRLDDKAVESLGSALQESPNGLRVDARGMGTYTLELVRID